MKNPCQPTTRKKEVIRFIRVLMSKSAFVEQQGDAFVVQSAGRSARLINSCVRKLIADGVLDAQSDMPVANDLTRSWLRRALSEGEHVAAAQVFADQHRQTRQQAITGGPDGEEREDGMSPQIVMRNDNESPLAKLALLKKRDKSPYISPHHIVAGERLRRDFDKAHLGVPLVMNWSPTFSASKGGSTGGSDVSDMAIDARARLAKYYAAIGSEMASLLIDFCGYLKGLETIEMERGWPRRSAKLAIRLALDQLAHHYGLEETTTSNKTQSIVKSWGDKPTSFSAVPRGQI